jgi:putative aminopeptidase FrvX
MPGMQNLDFLKRLLEAAGPSGHESRAAQVWAGEAQRFSSVKFDGYGNVFAAIGAGRGLSVMLSGHLDEIGLMVSHVGDKGFAHVKPIGGWDAQVLPGQRVRLLARGGDLIGVVGRKPAHLLKGDDRTTAVKLEDLWVDFGLNAEEAKRQIRVGDVGVLDQPVLELAGGRIVSKALDNRLGAFIILEALRRLSQGDCLHAVTAVGAAQEEIGAFGAQVAAFELEPKLAIIVDVTHETSQPGVEESDVGVTPFGSGANLTFSALTHPKLNELMLSVAEKHGIKTSLSAYPRSTGTDADTVAVVRAGIPCVVLSIPLRYMHSPSEMADLNDAEAVIDLIVKFCLELPGDIDLSRV